MRNSFIIISLIFLLFSTKVFSQNLIPNGDFEIFSDCPEDISEFEFLDAWMNPSDLGSPDFFNACAQDSCAVSVPMNFTGNSIPAQSGTGYVGFGVALYEYGYVVQEAKEYLMIELSEDLIEGLEYTFTLYAYRPDLTTAASPIQAHISSIPLISEEFENIEVTANLLDTEPVSEIEWVKYSSDYISNGTEKYITIGNFQSIDSLEESILFPIDESLDLCDDIEYDEEIIYYLIDNVSFEEKVMSDNKNLQFSKYSITPNPVENNRFTIGSTSEDNDELYSVEILDQQGLCIKSIKRYQLGSNVDLSDIPEKGVYYLRVIGRTHSEVSKIIIL